MSDEEIERKIAVIFATDVVGYSKHMEANELQTLKNLKACREILEGLFKQHGGRTFNTAGDSVLGEFSSAVSAVVCASEFQDLIKERNQSSDNNLKMEFRIGINMGDVVQEKGNLYGEGVNIAARLEALSQPNGICLSKNVHDLVNSRTNFFFNDLGERKVKNTVLHAFDVHSEGDQKVRRRVNQFNRKSFFTLKPTWFISIALIVVILGTYFTLDTNKEFTGSENIVIAVMPFINKADTSQDYFVDGVTEDLNIDLSKIEEISVISSNSAFQFKGEKFIDVDAAKTLGADFLLKGSIRKTENDLRLNVELIDGSNGNIVWAEKFNKKPNKILEIEDEVILGVADHLSIKLQDKETEAIKKQSTANLVSYDLYKKGLAANDRESARRFYKQAIELDPNFGRAYASLSINISTEIISPQGSSLSKIEAKLLRDEALKYAKFAQELSPNEAIGYYSSALAYNLSKEFEEAKQALKKALEVDPDDTLALILDGTIKVNQGSYEEGLAALNSVKKLDPFFTANLLIAEAQGNMALGRYEMALSLAEQHLQRNPESSQAMLNYITAAWNLEMYDDALWQYEEVKLRASNKGISIFEYIKKQAWNLKVKEIIQKTIETIENQ